MASATGSFSGNGAVIDSNGVLLASSGFADQEPALAFGGNAFLLAWTTAASATDKGDRGLRFEVQDKPAVAVPST